MKSVKREERRMDCPIMTNARAHTERLQGMVAGRTLRLLLLVVVLAGIALIAGTTHARAQEWKQVSAAAKREGKVVVSGPTGANTRAVLKDKFEAKFPGVEVEYTGLPGRNRIPRIMAERRAGKKFWDIYIGGPGSMLRVLKPAGALANLRPEFIRSDVKDDKNWYGGLAFGFLDNEQKYVYGFHGNLQETVWVNRTSIPPSQLSSPKQLIDPKFKGKIAIDEPRTGGPGISRVTALMMAYGEDFIKKLLTEQDVVIVRNYRQMAEWAVRGRYPIVVGLSAQMLQEFWAQGLGKDVKVVRPKAAVWTVSAAALSLMEGTPHPNAAKVYINWLLSKEGQELYAKATASNSRRTDVAPVNPDIFPDPKQLNQYIKQDEVFEDGARKTRRLARSWIK